MKKHLAIPMLALLLAACGNVSLTDRTAVGVSVTDAESVEVATKTITPATDTAPEKVSWTVTPGKGVTFTFMTRPGSDAVYMTGYKITRTQITTINGTTTSTTGTQANKMDLYLTSGYVCAARSATQSCPYNATDALPANGEPGQHTIYLESGLGATVVATDASVSQETDLEFYGTSSNGQAVTVKVSGVVSRGTKAGAL